ncbi:MAG: HlyD family efflux transporter periplasmic adaptor subunit [Planctomycetales bacterium]|nr:HlyD family efflux transporter periplasmic adaptor subunit [Planctomycetales bacterium]
MISVPKKPLVTALLLLAACFNAASADGPLVAEESSSADVPVVVGPLVIKLIDQVEVPALEAGALVQLHVKIGDPVKSGQVIARVDDRSSLAQRDLAETDLQISRQKSSSYQNDKIEATQWDEAKAALEQQKLVAKIAAEKSSSDVRVSAAEKAEGVAKNEWVRAQSAHEKFADSVSESELENLRLKYEHSRLERVQAAFEQRIDRLAAESESQGVRVAELAAERAEILSVVAAADAQLFRLDVVSKEKTLQLRQSIVDRHQVAAPIDGVVVEIYKRPGEWVLPGDSVARVINLDQLHAEGFLSGNVRPQRGRKVRLRSGSDTLDGTVDFVSPERDLVSGEFRFVVRIAGGTFLPGDRVEIQW